MKSKLSIEEINEIIGCPRCKTPISGEEGEDVVCRSCGEVYRRHFGTLILIPSNYRSSSELWPVWEELQANGLVSYKEDPENNLAIGERLDCLAFSRFCKFDGLVLDVGCGPQAWPTYFTFRTERTRFVGIDPLIQDADADFTKFIALGEYLPFQNKVFDHVVFATSLDHFIDPRQGLREAWRVCQPRGEIDIWLGVKRSDAPRPVVSPDWYRLLKKPGEAEDFFHLRRPRPSELQEIFEQMGLSLREKEIQNVDEFRSNIFYRLKLR